ncbi:hypothetical protein RIF29_27436 [Crotalaria pallida]|uniref:Uncharacterized protein n=1 Tax=Crotalaria pallida TaxID=3830 RepID=A0AAN9EPK3_CROPI
MFFLLSLLCLTHFPTPLYSQVDYHLLALTWLAGFCLNRACNVVPPYFTIHGLWPQSLYGPPPRNCPAVQPIPTPDPSQWTELFSESMHTYGPDLSNYLSPNYMSFWLHEWHEHDSCVPNLFGTEVLTNIEQYFVSTLTAYLSILGQDLVERAGFCLNRACNVVPPYFTIHGLWPPSLHGPPPQNCPVVQPIPTPYPNQWTELFSERVLTNIEQYFISTLTAYLSIRGQDLVEHAAVNAYTHVHPGKVGALLGYHFAELVNAFEGAIEFESSISITLTCTYSDAHGYYMLSKIRIFMLLDGR